jgi:hypothetical protein
VTRRSARAVGRRARVKVVDRRVRTVRRRAGLEVRDGVDGLEELGRLGVARTQSVGQRSRRPRLLARGAAPAARVAFHCDAREGDGRRAHVVAVLEEREAQLRNLRAVLRDSRGEVDAAAVRDRRGARGRRELRDDTQEGRHRSKAAPPGGAGFLRYKYSAPCLLNIHGKYALRQIAFRLLSTLNAFSIKLFPLITA